MVEIFIQNIKKTYRGIEALRGVSLEVEKQQLFGLIGPDGAGKTTLMRILCGLVSPDSGAYKICGSDNPGFIKKQLGYMPQRFSLYPDLTVEENIRFFARLFSVHRNEFKPRFARLMEFSNLGPFVRRRAENLSGGMKQKLALCCTLIHTPEVLILDEPTTGVDAVSRIEFWDILAQLIAQGVSILISTPYMDEALKCHQIGLIHQGRILAVDSPEDIPGLFHLHVLEWIGKDIFQRAKQLLELPGVKEVHPFGNRLHVITEDIPTCLKQIAGNTDLPSESFREVPASIEDTFINLMEQVPENHER